MASAKTTQKLSAFLVPAKQGGLYVNEYCYYFTVRVIGGMDIVKTKLNKKEHLFCAVSYTPKATVQVALGTVPLAMGLSCGEIDIR